MTTDPRNINVRTYNKYGPSVIPAGCANAGGTMSSRTSDFVLVMDGKRFGLGYSEANTWVNRGEGMSRFFTEEPVPYVFGLCVVIDNYGGTGAEAKRNRESGIEFDVDYGDYVIADNDLVFKVVELYSHGRFIDRHHPFTLEYVGRYDDFPVLSRKPTPEDHFA